MACNTHITRSTKPRGIFGVIPDGCSGHVVNLKQLVSSEKYRQVGITDAAATAYTFIIHKFMKLKFQNGCLAVSAHYYRVRHISCGIPGVDCRNVTQTTSCHSDGDVYHCCTCTCQQLVRKRVAEKNLTLIGFNLPIPFILINTFDGKCEEERRLHTEAKIVYNTLGEETTV